MFLFYVRQHHERPHSCRIRQEAAQSRQCRSIPRPPALFGQNDTPIGRRHVTQDFTQTFYTHLTRGCLRLNGTSSSTICPDAINAAYRFVRAQFRYLLTNSIPRGRLAPFSAFGFGSWEPPMYHDFIRPGLLADARRTFLAHHADDRHMFAFSSAVPSSWLGISFGMIAKCRASSC